MWAALPRRYVYTSNTRAPGHFKLFHELLLQFFVKNLSTYLYPTSQKAEAPLRQPSRHVCICQ